MSSEYPGSNEPTPYQTPMAPAAGYAPAGVAPVAGNSGLAIASLILGIVGLCTGIAGIAAVICGHMALGRINKSNGMLKGKGMAIAGLVLGYLEIVAMVAWVVFVVVAVMTNTPATTPQ